MESHVSQLVLPGLKSYFFKLLNNLFCYCLVGLLYSLLDTFRQERREVLTLRLLSLLKMLFCKF